MKRSKPVIFDPSLAVSRQAYISGRAEEAFEICRDLAQTGHAEAQATLSAMWLYGQGRPQSAEEAETWARKAPRLGSAHGTYVLAFVALYRERPELARRRMLDAAERDFPPAVLSLGRFCIDGIGAPADPARGIQLYRRATTLGHTHGGFALRDYIARTAATRPRRLMARLHRAAEAIRAAWMGAREPLSPLNTLYAPDWTGRTGKSVYRSSRFPTA